MAIKGVTGKILFVDLADGTVTAERLGDDIYQKYIGGYGLGAYILFTRQRGGVDPLGPDALFGFVTGPLTGTSAITGNRFVIVGKSPKTGTWGDANCGGYFGPTLKWAGADAVFFKGISPGPVIFVVSGGQGQLVGADELWGLDARATEENLRRRYGPDSQVAVIGPPGERKSLLACVMNDYGRAAGRSGLGAVMGAKRVKAVVAVGKGQVPVADAGRMERARKESLTFQKSNNFYKVLTKYGTSGILAAAAESGDSPIKNWKGTSEDFSTAAKISDDSIQAIQERKYGCWHCPIACGGHVKVREGKYAGEEGHKPEYETLSAFGAMMLVDDLGAIVRANNLCNQYGMDTISVGCTIAFAFECYEQGLITKGDTGGLELTWGSPDAVVMLTEQIAKGEGFGKVLADGAKVAAERIGKGAEQYAIHCHGEELPLHDPRLNPGIASSYKLDATPGRHTQFSAWPEEAQFAPAGLPYTPVGRYEYSGKAECHRVLSGFLHVVNAAGMCMFGACTIEGQALPEFLSAAMGKEMSLKDVLEIGDRIAALRMAFNIREGIVPTAIRLPPRVLGVPPLVAGDTKGVTLDLATQEREYLEYMGWDVRTGEPETETLERLGLDFVARELSKGKEG